MVRDRKLDFWFKNGQNVLFIGKHGVGKTAKVRECFEQNGLVLNDTWLYFSASTLDPWVDLIGVPKETKNGDGTSYLELVRPKALASDKVEAVFFDEFNRSPSKVRNAVMELIQFKSINGMVFENLKVVWAAINPEDDEDETYDVEPLDPAQKDRFHIPCKVPYNLNRAYFTEKFGEGVALPAIEWWNTLPKEQKNAITPRRLDYALVMYSIKGDMRDVLPTGCNVTRLVRHLSTGSVDKKLKELCKAADDVASAEFLADENSYNVAVAYILKDKTLLDYFASLMPKEKLSALISRHKKVLDLVCAKVGVCNVYQVVAKEIVAANRNPRVTKQLKIALDSSGVDDSWDDLLNKCSSDVSCGSTPLRRMVVEQMSIYLPAVSKLKTASALKALGVVKNVVNRSHTPTLRTLQKPIVKVVDRCMTAIMNNEGLTRHQFGSRHAALMCMIDYLRTAGIYRKREKL